MLFKGHTAEEALAKVHETLGPAAIVVQLKRVPSAGVGRIWGAMEIEAWAQAPAATPTHLKAASAKVGRAATESGTAELIKSLGLGSTAARALQQAMPPSPSEPTSQEACLQLGAALLAAWDKAARRIPKAARRIALIGPAGTGKSVATAKWLTIETLRHQHDCRLWCLDGIVANTAEFLIQHADLLGIPVETTWNPGLPSCSREFLDLPGWSPSDRDVSDRMANLLDRFEPDCLLLTLNAAYEPGLLQEQVRAFEDFKPHGLLLTHLDESASPTKVWDLVLGQGIAPMATSSGRFIPGGFERTGGELWMERLFAQI
jgi:flagellar biosynthesis GTPase FlhF